MSIFDAYLQLVYSGKGVGKLEGVGGPGDNRNTVVGQLVACQLVLHLKNVGVFIFSR